MTCKLNIRKQSFQNKTFFKKFRMKVQDTSFLNQKSFSIFLSTYTLISLFIRNIQVVPSSVFVWSNEIPEMYVSCVLGNLFHLQTCLYIYITVTYLKVCRGNPLYWRVGVCYSLMCVYTSCLWSDTIMATSRQQYWLVYHTFKSM